MGQCIFMRRRLKKYKPNIPEASMYLYGTPNESGNIGLRSGDSVSYYDGTVLDALEWDEKTYPYLFVEIWYNNYSKKWSGSAVATAEPAYIKDFTLGTSLEEAIHWDGIPAIRKSHRDGQWSEWSESTTFTNIALNNGEIIFAYYDIYKNGVLWQAATEPITIYKGIVDYVGDIPIYE